MQTNQLEDTLEVVDSFLSFKLNEEMFAIPVSNVIEILEVPKITKIPKAPDFLKGVINLRGSVLPLIDGRVKFGLEPLEFSVDTSILVLTLTLNDEEVRVGTLVDAVLEVFEVGVSQIQPSPTIGSNYNSQFIKGMIKVEEEFMMLLDLNKVFSTEEILTLQEQNQA